MELPRDLLAALGAKYGRTARTEQERRPGGTPWREPSPSDETMPTESGCFFTVAICGNGCPAPCVESREDRAVALTRKAPAEKSEHPVKVANKKQTLGSRLDAAYSEIPICLRDALEPHISYRNRNSADEGKRYVNVTRQGGGFQVQKTHDGKSVRLATVSDAKVGALLVAASKRDPDLLEHPLRARDWLTDLMRSPEKAEAWLARLRTGD